jgi:hypothetical protein
MAAAVALGSLPPSDPAEWGADQKNGQNNQWRKDQRQKKRQEKPAAAVYAAYSGQSTNDHVKNQFEHGPVLINSPFRASLGWTSGPITRAVQEPACSAGASALRAETFDRESHISFWALTNSR